MDTEAAETLRRFADENGFISRNSMRAALVATLGDTVSDADVDVVMEKINGGGGNSVVSVTEVEAVFSRRNGESSTPSSSDTVQREFDLEHTLELDGSMTFDEKLAKDYEVNYHDVDATNRRPSHDPPLFLQVALLARFHSSSGCND